MKELLKRYWLTMVLVIIIVVLVVRSCGVGGDEVVVVDSQEYLEKEKQRMQDTVSKYNEMLRGVNERYDSLKVALKKERELRSLRDSTYNRQLFDLYRMNDDEQMLLLLKNLNSATY